MQLCQAYSSLGTQLRTIRMDDAKYSIFCKFDINSNTYFRYWDDWPILVSGTITDHDSSGRTISMLNS